MHRFLGALVLAYMAILVAPRLATATMFVTSRNDSRLVEFDETSGTLVASFNVPSDPDGVTVYNGSLYVSSKSHSSNAHDAHTLLCTKRLRQRIRGLIYADLRAILW
jgi:hypothetical protein